MRPPPLPVSFFLKMCFRKAIKVIGKFHLDSGENFRGSESTFLVLVAELPWIEWLKINFESIKFPSRKLCTQALVGIPEMNVNGVLRKCLSGITSRANAKRIVKPPWRGWLMHRRDKVPRRIPRTGDIVLSCGRGKRSRLNSGETSKKDLH